MTSCEMEGWNCMVWIGGIEGMAWYVWYGISESRELEKGDIHLCSYHIHFPLPPLPPHSFFLGRSQESSKELSS